MTDTVVTLKLNQQQLELMDRTIAQGVAPDRVSLVRLALREYAATRKAEEPAR
jgi:Arc/MetJ-type ribon-helix-helix transcriptional regulator